MRRLRLTIDAVVFLDAALLFALVPLLPDYTRELGMSKAQAGIAVGAYSGAVFAFAVPAGQYADRVGARRLTMWGLVLLCLGTGAYAFANEFWMLVAARVAQGISSAISWTAGLAWLSASTPPERRGRTLGEALSAANAGALLGPLVGGGLGEVLGIRGPFVVCAVAAALLVPLVMAIPGGDDAEAPNKGVLRAARASVGNRLIVSALLVMTVAAIVSGALETLVPLRLGDDGYSTLAITAVLTVVGVVATVANITIGAVSDRVGRIPIGAAGIVLTAAGLTVLAVVPDTRTLIGAYVAFTPAISALYAVAFPLSTEGADQARLGHGIVMGLINLAWGLGFLIGPAAGAAIADAWSDSATYAILAVTSLVAGAALWLALQQRECQPAA